MTGPLPTGAPGTGPPGGRTGPGALAAIAAGGVLGASARYGLGLLAGSGAGDFPWVTFAENVSGAFLLGLVLIGVARRFPGSRSLRLFAAVGFLGSYTTFSALAVEADLLARDGRAGLAVAYWGASLGAGLVAAAGGIAVARRLWPAGRRR